MVDAAATLSTDRLDLVPMTPDFYRASFSGDLEEAGRIIGARVPAAWLSEQALITLRSEQLEIDPGLQPWLLRAIILRSEGVMAGFIGFHTYPDPPYLSSLSPGSVEFGYSVFEPYRRRGIAREASQALMDWAQQGKGVNSFVLSIRPDNLPSLNLAAQLGFVKIGSLMDEEDGLEEVFERKVKTDTQEMDGSTSGMVARNTSYISSAAGKVLRHEAVIPADQEAVWTAFSTSRGLSSFAAPLVRIDPRPGGLWESSYRPGARPGDPTNIHNEVLSLLPPEMLSIRIARTPPGFPTPEIASLVWTVIQLFPVGTTETRVVTSMLGWKEGPDWDTMYRLFERGNAIVLQNLYAYFTTGPVNWETQE